MLEAARKAEHQKYIRTYRSPKYKMKAERMKDAVGDLAALPVRGAYLDVSCGRGQILAEAAKLGFKPVCGTEIVPSLIDGKLVRYAEAHALPFPDNSFTVVSMFDVIEHLLPGDDELACRELARVATDHILISANNKPSVHNGTDLHINKRPTQEWLMCFGAWFDGDVAQLTDRHDRGPHASSWWRIDL